ncbi:hypothetical protein B566_EDAN012948, partial [Ephemera danica]
MVARMEETKAPELSLYDACELACHQSVHFVMEGVSMRDPLFKELYRDVTFTGSSNEGLKIGPPNEYDVNINLFLPMMPSL